MSSPLYALTLMGDCPRCRRLVTVEVFSRGRDDGDGSTSREYMSRHQCAWCQQEVSRMRLVRA